MYACLEGFACLLGVSTLLVKLTVGMDVTGAPSLAEMMDVQEMAYDPESGCLFSEITTYLLLEGGAQNLRMRQSQWLWKPLEIEELPGCEVRIPC
jgi:hypothetical protein